MAVKSTNFHDAEIEQIARTWIVISDNPIVGVGQKADTFWTSIQNHFNKSMEQFRKQYPRVVQAIHRTMRSVQSKWGDINHDCGKFSGNFSTIEALNESGTTYEQKIEKAKTLYQQTHKKGEESKMIGCWDLLKDNPKWQIASRLQEKQNKKRRRNSTAAAIGGNENSPDPSIVLPGDVGLENPEVEKRVGNKKAKEIAGIERRGHKGREGLADATSQIAAALNRRAESMEDTAETQLFMTNIERLDPQARSFLLRKRLLADMRLQEKLEQLQSRRQQSVRVAHVQEITADLEDRSIPLESGTRAQEEGEESEDIIDDPSDEQRINEPLVNSQVSQLVADSQVQGTVDYLNVQDLYRWA